MANWTHSDKDVKAGAPRFFWVGVIRTFSFQYVPIQKVLFFEQPTTYFNLIESHKFIDARYFHFLFFLSVFLKHIARCGVCVYMRGNLSVFIYFLLNVMLQVERTFNVCHV